MPQHDLPAVVVHARLEAVSAARAWRRDRPARETPGNFLHVFLGVPALDAERVQFHQLARVVLVQAAAGAVLPGKRTSFRCRALPVVEVEEHRGALGGRAEQIAEFAEDAWPDGVAFVFRQVDARLSLARKDVEVIEPEVRHYLFELAIAVGGAKDLLRGELREYASLGLHRLHLLGRAIGRARRLRRPPGLHRRVARRLLGAAARFDRRQEIVARQLFRAFAEGLEP